MLRTMLAALPFLTLALPLRARGDALRQLAQAEDSARSAARAGESGASAAAWADNGTGFDGLAKGEDAADGAVAAPAADAAAPAGLVKGAPAGVAEQPAGKPVSKPGYWKYNDYSHSTGESVGMLLLDVGAWVLAPVLIVGAALAVVFSFLLPK